MHHLIGVLIFAVIVSAAFIWIAVWVILLIFRGIGTLLGVTRNDLDARRNTIPWMRGGRAPGRTNEVRKVGAFKGQVQCPGSGCCALNPAGSRFCRRCGRAMLPESTRWHRMRPPMPGQRTVA